MSIATSWQYHDTHVDSTITGSRFASGNRTVIYAGPYSPSSSLATSIQGLSPIGAVQSLNHAEQRQMAKIFEIGSDLPYHVLGASSGNINLSRVMVNGKDLVSCLLGTSSEEDVWIKSLSEVDTPINLCFVCFPNGMDASASATNFSRLFLECYIQARNESISAGQIILAEQVSISYTQIGSGAPSIGTTNKA